MIEKFFIIAFVGAISVSQSHAHWFDESMPALKCDLKNNPLPAVYVDSNQKNDECIARELGFINRANEFNRTRVEEFARNIMAFPEIRTAASAAFIACFDQMTGKTVDEKAKNFLSCWNKHAMTIQSWPHSPYSWLFTDALNACHSIRGNVYNKTEGLFTVAYFYECFYKELGFMNYYGEFDKEFMEKFARENIHRLDDLPLVIHGLINCAYEATGETYRLKARDFNQCLCRHNGMRAVFAPHSSDGSVFPFCKQTPNARE